MTGYFLAVEGGDGAGKSTLVTALADALEGEREVVRSREPGATEFGAILRSALLGDTRVDPIAELMGFSADRAQHVSEVIRPALERGAFVIVDRFVDSSVAYQGAGRGHDEALVRHLSDIATDELTPHLTLVIDVPVEIGLKRAVAGGRGDAFERLGPDFHEKVRRSFLRSATLAPERYAVLDGAQEPEEVQRQAVNVLGKSLMTTYGKDQRQGSSVDEGDAPTKILLQDWWHHR